MGDPAVIETGLADHAKANFAAHGFDAPNDIMGMAHFLDWHAIGNLGDAVIRQEARQQNIGVGQIKLAMLRVVQNRRDAEVAAFVVIEKPGKNSRRVEVRERHEIDGAIHADQSNGVEVADDAIVFDGLIFRFHILIIASQNLNGNSRQGKNRSR